MKIQKTTYTATLTQSGDYGNQLDSNKEIDRPIVNKNIQQQPSKASKATTKNENFRLLSIWFQKKISSPDTNFLK